MIPSLGRVRANFISWPHLMQTTTGSTSAKALIADIGCLSGVAPLDAGFRTIEKTEPAKRQFVHDSPLLRVGYLVRQPEGFHGAQLIKVGRSHGTLLFGLPFVN